MPNKIDRQFSASAILADLDNSRYLLPSLFLVPLVSWCLNPQPTSSPVLVFLPSSSVLRPPPRCPHTACLASPSMCDPSFDADPSTPSPTRAPAFNSSIAGAIPAPSLIFELGQCATPVFVFPSLPTS